MPTPAEMLELLDAFTNLFDSDDQDPNYNQAIGAAAALRYMLHGPATAGSTLPNILQIASYYTV